MKVYKNDTGRHKMKINNFFHVNVDKKRYLGFFSNDYHLKKFQLFAMAVLFTQKFQIELFTT